MTATPTAPATPYAWVITKDCLPPLEGFKSIEGVAGPRGLKLTRQEIEAHPKAQKFRLKDDDGELYCEGVFVDLTPDQRCDGFEPLDNYGTGALGATTIEYWQPGKGGGWKPL